MDNVDENTCDSLDELNFGEFFVSFTSFDECSSRALHNILAWTAMAASRSKRQVSRTRTRQSPSIVNGKCLAAPRKYFLCVSTNTKMDVRSQLTLSFHRWIAIRKNDFTVRFWLRRCYLHGVFQLRVSFTPNRIRRHEKRVCVRVQREKWFFLRVLRSRLCRRIHHFACFPSEAKWIELKWNWFTASRERA